MTEESREIVTAILGDVGLTDHDRASRLLPLVYDQLRRVAQHRMGSERSDHSLQATALVHEAWLRLAGDRDVPWRNRAHFYAAAAEAMQRILLDHARARGRTKRGGVSRRRVPLSVVDLANLDDFDQIVALDAALRRLTDQDARIGQVVRLRFFAGLTIDETAAALGHSSRTVKRDWEFARAWLFSALEEDVETD